MRQQNALIECFENSRIAQQVNTARLQQIPAQQKIPVTGHETDPPLCSNLAQNAQGIGFKAGILSDIVTYPGFK